MKTRIGGFLLPFTLLLTVVGCVLAESPKEARKAGVPARDKVGPREISKLLPKLKQGMPAEAVRRLLGAPDDVSPMEAPTGKAEVWAYGREVSRRREEVVTYPNQQVVVEPQANGPPITRTVLGAPQTIYLEYVVTEKVEVLMFDGSYVVHKVSREERKL